jgi:hypothetical protein
VCLHTGLIQTDNRTSTELSTNYAKSTTSSTPPPTASIDDRRQVDANDVVVALMSGIDYLRDRGSPIMSTWANQLPNVYFGVALRGQQQKQLPQSYCSTVISQTTTERQQQQQQQTEYRDCETLGHARVVATSACGDSIWDTGCKFNELLKHVIAQRPNAAWFIVGDDDIYVRSDEMLALLGELDADEPTLVVASYSQQHSPCDHTTNAFNVSCGVRACANRTGGHGPTSVCPAGMFVMSRGFARKSRLAFEADVVARIANQ